MGAARRRSSIRLRKWKVSERIAAMLPADAHGMRVSEKIARSPRVACLCSDVRGRNVSGRDAGTPRARALSSISGPAVSMRGAPSDASCVRMKRFAPEGHYRER